MHRFMYSRLTSSQFLIALKKRFQLVDFSCRDTDTDNDLFLGGGLGLTLPYVIFPMVDRKMVMDGANSQMESSGLITAFRVR